LVNELTGLTNTIGEVIHGGESMMSSLRRIMQKVNEEPCNDRLTLEKTNGRSSSPLIRHKSGHVLDSYRVITCFRCNARAFT
jgi:hypothetical protein